MRPLTPSTLASGRLTLGAGESPTASRCCRDHGVLARNGSSSRWSERPTTSRLQGSGLLSSALADHFGDNFRALATTCNTQRHISASGEAVFGNDSPKQYPIITVKNNIDTAIKTSLSGFQRELMERSKGGLLYVVCILVSLERFHYHRDAI